MLDSAQYSAIETLRDGRRVEIRALAPDDRVDLLAAINRASSRSIYRRFFAARRGFSESEIAFFLNIDFVSHVGLVALAEEAGRRVIVGGCRYVVVRPGTAELAFAVIDPYQGMGIGRALMRHLTAIARQAGITELIADVLPENVAMLQVFKTAGLRVNTLLKSGVVHVTMALV